MTHASNGQGPSVTRLGDMLPAIMQKLQPPKVNVVSAADLMSLDLPDTEWIVRDLLPVGLTILAGRPKRGKSWLTLGLLASVAAGAQALGTIDVAQAGCLYLALEDGNRRLQKRLRTLLGGRAAQHGLHLATDWPRMDQGGLLALDAWLTDHPEVRFVAIDTLAKIRPHSSGANQYETDYYDASAIKDIADRHQVAIVVIHHTRKPSGSRGAKGEDASPLNEVSGTTGLTGAADAVLVLERSQGQAQEAVLSVTGRDMSEAELALAWQEAACTWLLTGSAGDARQRRKNAVQLATQEKQLELERRRVLEAIRESADTKSGLSKRTGLETTRVTRAIESLLQAGLIMPAKVKKHTRSEDGYGAAQICPDMPR